MEYLASITSKRQLTIPIAVFKKINLKSGQKVIIKHQGDLIIIQPATNLVEKLAGSVAIPPKYKNLSPKEIVELAKSEYFSK